MSETLLFNPVGESYIYTYISKKIYYRDGNCHNLDFNSQVNKKEEATVRLFNI